MNYESKLRVIYPAMRKSCIGYAIKRGGTALEAEEAMHEGLHRLFNRLYKEKDYKIEQTLEKAIFSFFENVWRERYGLKKRQKVLTTLDGENEHLKNQQQDESAAAAFEIDDKEPLIIKSIKKLGDGCRNLLMAYYVEERKLVAIEKDLNLSKGAAKVKKNRCMSSLKLTLVEHLKSKLSTECYSILKAYFKDKKSFGLLTNTMQLTQMELETKKDNCMQKLSELL